MRKALSCTVTVPSLDNSSSNDAAYSLYTMRKALSCSVTVPSLDNASNDAA